MIEMKPELPQAFPVPPGFIGPGGEEWLPINGMTLRDYFAAAALSAVIARKDADTFEDQAAWCYGVADALLAVRDR